MERRGKTYTYDSIIVLANVVKQDMTFSKHLEAKQKYLGMFETPKSGNKTSSGEIGLNILTPASPKVRQDQVSGGVSSSIACRTRCKCSVETSRN